MNLGIHNKNVLITGGSQGIGLSIAKAFYDEGANVHLISRSEKKLIKAASSISEKSERVSFESLDLLDKSSLHLFSQSLCKRDRHFDIVIHNVGGTLEKKDPLTTLEEWQEVWMFNVGIAISINNALAPRMKERGWGRLVHVSSISATSLRGSAPYAASKAYLNAYVTCLGRALAPFGIIASALMPGAILAEEGHWDRIKKERPEIISDFLRHHQAIGRLGTPDEIAPLAVFMASKQATFTSGSIIPIDGGSM